MKKLVAVPATETRAETQPVKEESSEYFRDSTQEHDIALKNIIQLQQQAIKGTHSLQEIYFDFNSSDIKQEAEVVLMQFSGFIINNGLDMIIEGHCDEKGTNQYNLALGDKRANAVKEFLISTGVPASRVRTISYGEEKPQCGQPADSCWALNRRAHFVIR